MSRLVGEVAPPKLDGCLTASREGPLFCDVSSVILIFCRDTDHEMQYQAAHNLQRANAAIYPTTEYAPSDRGWCRATVRVNISSAYRSPPNCSNC